MVAGEAARFGKPWRTDQRQISVNGVKLWVEATSRWIRPQTDGTVIDAETGRVVSRPVRRAAAVAGRFTYGGQVFSAALTGIEFSPERQSEPLAPSARPDAPPSPTSPASVPLAVREGRG